MSDTTQQEITQKKEEKKEEKVQNEIKRNFHVGGDKSEVSCAVAQYILEKYNQAVAKTGRFTVAFSGGSLPAIVADGIMNNKDFEAVDFSKWFIFFADERCVSLSHSDSNYLSVKEKLFDKCKGIKKENVFAIDENLLNDPTSAASAYQEQLKKVFTKNPVFDLILLGMGEDGHTCSLFPGHPLSQYRGEKWVESITDSPKMPPNRITLTFPVLHSAKDIAFVATGGGKKEVLYSICNENNKQNYPAGNVFSSSGQVDWFVDKAAAAKL